MNLDKAVTSLLAGAGVFGIVIGFAFQEISSNFLAGIIIAFQKPYQIGDVVEAHGFTGTVRQIGLRATIIKTFDGLDVIVPNKYFLTEPLINFTQTNDRRFTVEVGVSYADDLDHVKKVLEDVLEDVPDLMEQRPKEVYAHAFGDSSINFLVRGWVEYPGNVNFFRVPDIVIRKIKKAFDREGITIPFPIRTLDFDIKGGGPLKDQLNSRN
jgi:small-conductance mechanosensitive channel